MTSLTERPSLIKLECCSWDEQERVLSAADRRPERLVHDSSMTVVGRLLPGHVVQDR